jgi:biopolymer transport protein ExbD
LLGANALLAYAGLDSREYQIPYFLAILGGIVWMCHRMSRGPMPRVGYPQPLVQTLITAVIAMGFGLAAASWQMPPRRANNRSHEANKSEAIRPENPMSTPTNHPLPAEFTWREVAMPALGKEMWKRVDMDPALRPVVEIQNPAISARRFAIIGEVKYENVEDTAYLEMWSHISSPSGKVFHPHARPARQRTDGRYHRFLRLAALHPALRPERHYREVSKLEVNLHLPAKGKVYLRGLRLVEDPAASLPQATRPAAFKPIPKEAAFVFEQLRNIHESPHYKDLLKKHPIDETDRAMLKMDVVEYEYEVKNRLEILKELLRDTAAESLLAESITIMEEARAQSAPNREKDPELIRRAEAVGKQLEELLQMAAQAPTPPESALKITPPSNAADAPAQKAIVITLAADGALTLAGQPCPLDQLADRLNTLATQEPVFIRLKADRKTPFRQVVNVVETCKGAGIDDVTFSVEPP